MAKAILPEGLVESVALARQTHAALSAVNQLLANAEQGSTIECHQLASLLVLVQDNMGTLVDDLAPIAGVVHAA